MDTLTHHREKNNVADVDPRYSPIDVIDRSKCSGYRDPRVPAGEKDNRLAWTTQPTGSMCKPAKMFRDYALRYCHRTSLVKGESSMFKGFA